MHYKLDVPPIEVKIAIERMLHGGYNHSCGICFNLTTLCGAKVHAYEFRDVFKAWPEFKGDPDFPIGGEFEYMVSKAQGALWLGESKMKRMRLLQFMLAELEKQYGV